MNTPAQKRQHRPIWDAWHRPGWFSLLLGIGVIAANHRVVFGGESFALGDFTVFGYPLACHLQASLQAGELPLWNPLNECGQPFLAQWNTMTLYPPMLLTTLFPLASALSLFCLAHQYLGGLGMYFLARSWTRNGPAGAIAAVVYAFDGIMQNSLMWPNNIAALGLLPWVMLTARIGWQNGRRSLLAAALVATLQLLTGAPEMILVTWLFVLLALVHDLGHRPRREMLLRCGSIIGLAAALAAAQLIPFFDLLIHSARAETGNHVQSHIHWYGWANYFLPLFNNAGSESFGGYQQFRQFWTRSFYLGYIPWFLLMLALTGNKRAFARNLAACSALALILAMGPDGRLYTWLNAALPLDLMRYPVKFLIILKVALPLLAAWGIRRLKIGHPTRAWFSIGLGIVGFAIAFWLQHHLILPAAGRYIAHMDAWARLGWLIGVAMMLMLVVRLPRSRRNLGLLGLMLVTGGDLYWHQPQLSPTVDATVFTRRNPHHEILQAAVYPAGRALPNMAAIEDQTYGETQAMEEFVASTRAWIGYNANLLDRVAFVGGFYSLSLARFDQVYIGMFRFEERLNDSFADFAAITCTTRGSQRFEWITRTNAQPLITIGRRPEFLPAEKLLERASEGRFNPAEEVLLDEATKDAFAPEASPKARVTSENITPHRIEFSTTSPQSTIATIAQIHHHWWQAEVDGEPVSIHPANQAFQAIAVPAGEHRVVLRYVDWGFRIGLVVSVLALISVMTQWVRLRNPVPREARPNNPSPRADR